MKGDVRKAVFPVAGLGTRFIPATKAIPKEMLPIVDKPLIQYAAEEVIAAGITELIFITHRTKGAISDHFDKAYELEAELEARGKFALLREIQGVVPDHVTCTYIRQAQALGLGHAVLRAKTVVAGEPFVVVLPDDLIYDENSGCVSQMIEVYRRHRCSVLAVMPVPESDTEKYGIVKATKLEHRISRIDNIIEKPLPSAAPSNLAVVGRYVLSPRVFHLLEKTVPGAGGEIQLTDAIEALLAIERVLALEFSGRRYDCGSKLGYLEANVEYALKHGELKDKFRSYLEEFL